MRGKVKSVGLVGGQAGIIPAGAGKSGGALSLGDGSGDHPRGCGEKAFKPSASRPTPGSSPRVRGKGPLSSLFPRVRGIIPAGAGKRRRRSRPPRRRRDHPRGCGEKSALPSAGFWSGGSSPRVRGKAGCRARAYYGRGIIPAGAGKRPQHALLRRPARDHPRGCGEKASREGMQQPALGSSPRVRGKGG